MKKNRFILKPPTKKETIEYLTIANRSKSKEIRELQALLLRAKNLLSKPCPKADKQVFLSDYEKHFEWPL